MKKLKLVSISEVKTAKDNRQFYTAEFQDPNNPFANSVKRNFWQQFNAAGEPIWKGADPAVVKTFIGKTLDGSIVSAQVEPYEIQVGDKPARTATTYTTVVLGSELPQVIFAQLGHKMANAETAPVAAAETADVEVA